MIELVFLAALAAVTGWLIRRKHRERTAAGLPQGIPAMARNPAGAGRWRAGRVFAAPAGEVRWAPGRGEPVALPGVRATGVRPPSVKEGLSINPGSRIVACAYEGGTIEIAVMALDLRELLEAVPADDGAGESG
ncbi:hypothetical protein AB0C97_34275 [Streptomyces goshikiensis]|uniref:hypothetical protein n=1 Tax=Streptomyces goshikiensis TaxID=1942 RepID=UPI001672251B|nr:hypothetical protein [Streptomyces goshikiensis]GHD70177.1 hypothetical protein GCM10010336_37780 [Streptomyces goshikiensis]